MKSEEVAKLAGVSRSTVSRVINNYSNVPDETRERVMKVIREYNYIPNTSARVLAGKGCNTIGLFIFHVHDRDNKEHVYGNSYFGPFVSAVVDHCNSRGYYLLIHTIYDASDCERIRETFIQKRMDGAIIIGTEKNSILEKLSSEIQDPLAIVDYSPKNIQRIVNDESRLTTINSDDASGISESISYLMSLGHKKIGLIMGRLETWSGENRYNAFKQKMEEHNLEVNENYILNGDFIREKTYHVVEEFVLRKELPTAFISSNDDMAFAAIEVFQKYGIRVPEDLSIIGFDDTAAASLVRPALTSVRVPFLDMAEKAVETLIAHIEGENSGVESFKLDVKLIKRDSCAKSGIVE